MKRILVPTDFSATADKALQLAFLLARNHGASLLLFHSYVAVESPYIDSASERDEWNRETRSQCMERLERLRSPLVAEDPMIAVELALTDKHLLVGIRELANSYQADLVVMGTQGASGLKKLTIGTIAAAVAAESLVPVILVPEKFNGSSPKSIVFASNFDQREQMAFHYAISFSRVCQAELTVVHLMLPGKFIPSSTDFMASLENLAREQGQNIRFCNVECRDLSTGLGELESILSHDMLIMVRRHRDDLIDRISRPSQTRSMCYVSTKPLMIIPETRDSF